MVGTGCVPLPVASQDSTVEKKAKNSTRQSYKRLGPCCVRFCRVETVYGPGRGAPWPTKNTFVGSGFIFTLQFVEMR